MKKRVLSLFMALALCLTLLPTAALAEIADDIVRKYRDDTGTNANDSYILGGDTTVQDMGEIGAAVKAAQALIDALPNEVTVDNVETLEAQLIAIEETLKALSEEQIAKLDMTRYKALYESMTSLTAVQATHTNHPICGDVSCNKTEHELSDGKSWTAINDANGLTSIASAGYYYLNQNVTLTDSENTWEPASGVVLCLNGKSITVNGAFDAIKIPSGSTFTLCDCTGTGSITHGTDNSDQKYTGRGVYVSGMFNMYGGKIFGNTIVGNGGGVYVDGSGSTFTMNGTAEIIGNEANIDSSNAGGRGGGVYVFNGGSFEMSETAKITNNGASNGGGVGLYYSSKFTMSNTAKITDNNASYGGGVFIRNSMFAMSGTAEISGNKATSDSGGVRVLNGSFTMSDNAKITGNTAADTGGGVSVGTNGKFNVSGAPSITGNKVDAGANNNVYLGNNRTITVTGALVEGASIGVSTEKEPAMNAPVTIAQGGGDPQYPPTDEDAKKFSIDAGDGYEIILDSDNIVKLQKSVPHTHYLCGGAACNKAGHTCTDKTTFNKWESTTTLPTEGTYYLTDKVTLTSTHTVTGNLVLDLNGYDITMSGEGEAIKVTGTFTLTDCKGGKANYGKITHKDGATGCGVNMDTSGASFTMYGGSIADNGCATTGNSSSSYNGAGVFVDSGAAFTMYGGEVADNKANALAGGGVYTAGTFNLYGGSISGNSAKNGGGVYAVGSASFTMNGGAVITGNTATKGNGGGIYGKGAITLTDATVTGNNRYDVYYDGKESTTPELTVSGSVKAGYYANEAWKLPILVSGALREDSVIHVGVYEGIKPGYGKSLAIAEPASGVTLSAENFKADAAESETSLGEGGGTQALNVKFYVRSNGTQAVDDSYTGDIS